MLERCKKENKHKCQVIPAVILLLLLLVVIVVVEIIVSFFVIFLTFA